MIYNYAFKRAIEGGDAYLLKLKQLSFPPIIDLIITDEAGDILEITTNPELLENGIPNGFDDSSFLITLPSIAEEGVSEYELLGWSRYIEPEEEP